MTITKCDRCKLPIDATVYKLAVDPRTGSFANPYDLCDNCIIELKEFLGVV